MTVKGIVVALYALSAVLPIFGLFGLLRNAKREAREYAEAEATVDGVEPSYSQTVAHARFSHRAIPARPRAVRKDFVFIGLGLLFGATASIWSLFI